MEMDLIREKLIEVGHRGKSKREDQKPDEIITPGRKRGKHGTLLSVNVNSTPEKFWCNFKASGILYAENLVGYRQRIDFTIFFSRCYCVTYLCNEMLSSKGA